MINPYIYAAAGAFSPADLFASGEKGCWYDPNDISTLFQTHTTATPVTTNGQAVGTILDLSPNGNSMTQSNATYRPTYSTASGKFGVDFSAHYLFNSMNLIGTSVVSLVVALRARSLATQFVCEYADVGLDHGGFGISIASDGRAAGLGDGDGSGGSGNYLFNGDSSFTSTPASFVWTTEFNPGGSTTDDKATLRFDGVDINEAVLASSGTPTTAALSGHQFSIGARNGFQYPADMILYGMVLVNRALTTGERTGVEAWAAARL